ncbi:type VI secretion-associated protein [Rhodothermaceae bacterium RA]|nr:type VI secretion-associated protein [Rhodothermaceae bacterium RA]
MQADALPIAYFGKVPTFADFARYQATSPAWRALDEWVQRGIRRFATAHRALLREAARRAVPVSFAFASERTDTVLVGVMRPSRDQAGRFYPFCLACEVPAPAFRDRADWLPWQARPFLEEAARVVEAAAQGTLDYRALDEALPAVARAADGLLAPPGATADALGATPFKRFAESIWGDFEHGGKYVLFKNLLDILDTLRRMDRPRLRYGLVFPLGAEGGQAAAFWWALCRRLVPPEAAPLPTAFWPAPGAATANPRLALFYPAPAPGAFAWLLDLDAADPLRRDNDALCELERIEHGAASDAVLALPPEVGSLIESESATLADVLHRMASFAV